MGHLILLGAVVLAGMLGVKVGELTGRISSSTFVASLTSFLLYSGLLFAGCWLLYLSFPPLPQGVDSQLAELNARVKAQTERGVIQFGVVCWLVGGSLCAVVPIVQRRQQRAAR